MTQWLYPISDLNQRVTSWEKHGSATFFGAIDDPVDSHDGDATYLKPIAVDDIVKVQLSAGSKPAPGARHVVRVVSLLETCVFGVDLLVEIHQGRPTIASHLFAHGPQGSMEDPDPFVHCLREYELTPAQVARITKYSALEMWLYCTAGHGVTDGLHLTAADMFIE